MDALTASNHRGGQQVDTVVYDLHGRRHSAEDAGDIVALGVFASAMLKIRRVLDNSKKGGGNNDLLQTFTKFDTNRSGTLSRNEFVNVLLANGVKLTNEQTHWGDRLRRAALGFFNRRAFLKKWQHKKTKLSSREIKLLFYQCDRSGRGALSVPDFQLAMERIGFQFTESELKLLVLKFDVNQDGFIDYHEFHAFVNNGEDEEVEQIEQGTAGGNGDEKSLSRRDRSERESKSRSLSSLSAQYQQSRTKGGGGSEHGEESVELTLRERSELSKAQTKIRQSIRK